MITYIYTLNDPITNEIRYVGKSNTPNVRHRKHISEAKSNKNNNHKINWIKSLLAKNLKPTLDVIDEIEGDWVWLEEYWISQFKGWGFNLVNGTNGGENPPSWKGRTHSDEYKEIRKQIMLVDNPSKNMNDDWRDNISAAHKRNGFLPTKATESNRVKVNQYSLDGEFIKTWNSITDATKNLGLKSSYGIGAVCNNKRNKAGGYKWSFFN
jgi:hypothetical protein